ncbi:antA/AntB antirepressor family protein [Lacticaseibacillus paracasei]|uniref:Possible Anti-repressor n=1 Tax=Lacticaseibacillus paracasei NRIC 0644 TaxID=1435038 RepID=A0A0C9Q9B8_LACPA|nr:antA/AntB antirepressor family protein [Lacticaseibacillus paracasei]GAN36447.1 possible Anti-repressor [Lacticaseibacillus paracasei NRIC 0644]GAN39214.1 possible Anti-repressor [Lacticaseibacillus paracasei NRIC 1917]
MNELIKTITRGDGTIAVSGRELHKFLGVNDNYTDWFKRMTDYGFTENVDFAGLSEKSDKPTGGRPRIDHVMTLDMAKEVAMIQRTDRGKQARQYFLEVERRYKQGQIDTSGLSLQAQAALAAAQAIAAQEQRLNKVSSKVDAISDIVATSTMDWRKATRDLIHRIAKVRQGDYRITQGDIYKDVDDRAGAALNIRLTNLRRRMAEEGQSKSKRDKTNKVDVIANDKRLIEIYMAVVKDHAIKYRVWDDEY